MGLITDLTPLNQNTERAAFFADKSYNPQFRYVREFTVEELTQYGQPQKAYFEHAQQMLDTHGAPKKLPGKILTPAKIATTVLELLHELKLPAIPIHFEHHRNSQVLMSTQGIHFRLPIGFTKNKLWGKLNHELQTHYLRRYNQSLQSWDLKSEKKTPRAFRETEEGLANIHSYIERDDPIMRKTYLNYFASYLGQQLSFAELYHALESYGIREQLAWNLTVKQKRGLEDTSKPGGFSKNHIYFEGLVKVWQWIAAGNDPKKLYWGRISLEDIEQLDKLECNQAIIYPTFFANSDEYREKLQVIAERNALEKLV